FTTTLCSGFIFQLTTLPIHLTLIHFVCSFFQLYGHPQDLHSFPTRRSSDLWSIAPQFSTLHPSGLTQRLPKQAGLGFGSSSWRRSEEHTSELQSRVDLVCRLLLEKKKKNNSKSYR